MFAKLLKHEFKSQAGLFSVLSGAVLGAGLLGAVLMSIARNSARALLTSDQNELLSITGTLLPMLLMFFLLFAIVAYAYAVMILSHYRFYRRCFSDEGYLTFTLPVTSHQILLSSIVNTALWSLIAMVVALISCALILIPFFDFMEIFSGEILWESFSMAFTEMGAWYWISNTLAVVFSCVGALILPMLAITLGSVVVKKHKLLAGFGIYYGINMIVSAVTGVLNTVAAFGDIAVSEATGAFPGVFSILFPAVLYLGIGIGGYFLMHYLVDEKLNLA